MNALTSGSIGITLLGQGHFVKGIAEKSIQSFFVSHETVVAGE